MTNVELYGDLPKISDVIKYQRTRFSGHCWRSKNEIISKVLLWEPNHGKRISGKPRRTFVDQLADDSNVSKVDLATAMEDRNYWKERVIAVRPRSIQ